MNRLDRHIRSIHIIRNIRILNLTIILFNCLSLSLILTPQPLLLLLILLLLLLLLIIIIQIQVGLLIQIALLMCIGTLILEISLEEFLNGPTIGELM
jgi:hypothetical protein